MKRNVWQNPGLCITSMLNVEDAMSLYGRAEGEEEEDHQDLLWNETGDAVDVNGDAVDG